MNAREVFKVGQRVRLTSVGLSSLRPKRWSTGVVTGFAHPGRPNLVAVRPDGLKTANVYSMNFWEVCP